LMVLRRKVAAQERMAKRRRIARGRLIFRVETGGRKHLEN